MRMVVQLLAPCVQDLNDTGSCSEISLIISKFQDSLGSTAVYQTVHLPLVGINNGIKLFGECEDQVKIRSVNHLTFALINPDLLHDGLTVRTIPVAA